jgi:hypothetical protein
MSKKPIFVLVTANNCGACSHFVSTPVEIDQRTYASKLDYITRGLGIKYVPTPKGNPSGKNVIIPGRDVDFIHIELADMRQPFPSGIVPASWRSYLRGFPSFLLMNVGDMPLIYGQRYDRVSGRFVDDGNPTYEASSILTWIDSNTKLPLITKPASDYVITQNGYEVDMKQYLSPYANVYRKLGK